MTLTVLSAAFPLASVRSDTPGGAEQVLLLLDTALVRAGFRSIVVAEEGSEPRGELVAIPRARGILGEPVRRLAQENMRRAILRSLQKWPIDLVHMHGLDFHAYLPPPGIPVLVTLHLPTDWYPPEIFRLERPRTYLHCVSSAQHRTCPPLGALLPPIENGVLTERLQMKVQKREFAAALGRICPEKGFHLALDAARRAGIPLRLAGMVYPYEAHALYFREEIQPRLTPPHRFLGPVGFFRKRRLLSEARCLLLPSLAPETSSLAAMESLACGTPVVAFPAGALAEMIEPGRTGFLVKNAGEMAEAIGAARGLDPEVCRQAARERFSAERMARLYLERYRRLVAEGRG